MKGKGNSIGRDYSDYLLIALVIDISVNGKNSAYVDWNWFTFMDSIQCIAGSPLENYRHPFENVLFRQLQGKSEKNGYVKKKDRFTIR